MPQRDGIIERLQPLIGQLADGLVALASDMARENVLAALEAIDTPPVESKPVRVKAKRSGAKRKPEASKRPARAVKAKAAAGAKRQNHCRTCGAAGYQTKTCGRTHNLEGAIEPDDDEARDVVLQMPGKSLGTKNDRFRLLEEAARKRRGAA